MWIIITVIAAFAQSCRNALQSSLSSHINAVGVTLARFLFASPLVAIYLWALYQWQPAQLPQYNHSFGFFVVTAALMQILATFLMVRLFQLNNFAVGVGLAKSEALVAAIFGTLWFGTSLSLLGWFGVIVGGIAVMLLSSNGGWKQLSLPVLAIGIGSGSAFALTSLSVRQASIAIDLPFPHSAAWVLLSVLALQTSIMVAHLAWRDRQTLIKLFVHLRHTFAVSLSSCIGSIGWFSAMALEPVPLVKTLGQVEVFFTMMIALFWLKQPPKTQDLTGLILIAVAAVMVMWS